MKLNLNECRDGGKTSIGPMWRQGSGDQPCATLHVVGVAGWSGAGKTTLIEQLIPLLRAAGHWVATIKHAHCGFDLDVPGKDSWRARRAGACEVVVASSERVAVIRETPVAAARGLDDLLKELRPPLGETASWVLVEGFRQDPIPTIEVWRAALDKPLRVRDGTLEAVATADPRLLPMDDAHGHLPRLNLNDPQSIAAYLLGAASRYRYAFPREMNPATEAARMPAQAALPRW